MTDSNIDRYTDGTVINGEAVIYVINNVDTVGGETKLKITVNTLANSSGAVYGYDGSSSAVKYNNADQADPDYINPTASFVCSQTVNGNGIVTGLTFTQQS